MSKKNLLPNILLLLILLSSCTLQTRKGSYGLISTKELTANQKLVSQKEQLSDKKCLTFVLGIIPMGDFNFMKLTDRVDQIIDQSDALALANVEIEQSLSVFFPFYLKLCKEIQATPMVPLRP